MNEFSPDQPQPIEKREKKDFLQYWRILVRHKLSILGLAFISVLVTTLVVYNMTPIYRSTATIMIQPDSPKILSIQDIYNAERVGGEGFLQTQIQVLKSREIAERVAKKLGLEKSSLFIPARQSTMFWDKWFSASAMKPVPESEKFKIIVARLEGGLSISTVQNSGQIIKISFDSSDRDLAASIPNAYAEAYIESDLEAKVQMMQKANAWLIQRLGDLKKKLDASEQALQAYRVQANIVDTKGIALNGAGKQLDEISSNLIAARQRLAEAQVVYYQVENLEGQPLPAYESIPAVLRNTLYIQAKEAESKAEQKVAELRQRYGSMHPRMIAAQSDLRIAENNLKVQIAAVVGAIKKDYEMAKANEIAAEQAQGQVRSDIQNMSRKEFQLNVLQRDVDGNRQLYDLFMNRAKEMNVGANLQSTIARVIDPSIPADRPFKPDKKKIIGMSLVIGLALGIALSFLFEYLNNTLKNREDVEEKVGMNTLGVIHMLGAKSSDDAKRMFLDHPNSEFSESVRSIRTGVLLSSLDEPHKVVMVTSSLPQEGKSTLSVNLAFAVGQMKKVLLLEADLRRPSIADILHDDPSMPGLLEYLVGTAGLDQCIHKTESGNVSLIPCGKLLTNPLELISSRRFGEMLEKLSAMFEMVVIDSPPVVSVSDSLVLSRHASAVIYVVRADETPYQMVRSGIRRLRDVDAPLLGVVLNCADLKAEEGYGAYGYRYGYGSSSA